MELREPPQQAYRERDEAPTEAQRLWETVEAANAATVTLYLILLDWLWRRFTHRYIN